MRIMYWFDYACPYCYIGETSLKKALGNLKMEDQVTWQLRAFELDPQIHASDVLTLESAIAKKYGTSVQEAGKSIEAVNLRGRSLGLDMRYEKSRPASSFDAHRLTKLVMTKNDQALTDRFQELLFQAYFSKSLNIEDKETLLSLTEETGIERGEAERVLDSEQFSKEVREDEQAAAAEGITGVPFFVFDDEYAIPGALPPDRFEIALKRFMEQKKAE